MLFGFPTQSVTAAKAAMLVYATYRSRDVKRGPSGLDMWGQIERFIRSSAKRALTVGEFVNVFKRKMACPTLKPQYMHADWNAPNEYGEIIVSENKRQFLAEVLECPDEEQRDIVDCLYTQTAKIVLLVRSRLEDEKIAREAEIEEGEEE